jgi:putative ABC transport system substrate-binding protein
MMHGREKSDSAIVAVKPTAAARYALPAMHAFHECATAGGLMSYGPSRSEAVRSVAAYVARVFKGERPADLPVQQSTKVELILNLKTAKALGLTFQVSLLGRADQIIE